MRTPIAVPHYESEQDYEAILKLLPPSESHHAVTFEVWVKLLEGQEKLLRDSGASPVHVKVNPAAVKEWCDRANLPVCRDSITRYITTLLAAKLASIEDN